MTSARASLGLGLGLIGLGFWSLTQVDPRAENVHGLVAPFSILGGYVLVGLSLALEPAPAAEDGETPAEP